MNISIEGKPYILSAGEIIIMPANKPQRTRGDVAVQNDARDD
jgi:quercetin dioxygenase-like cupin family protein